MKLFKQTAAVAALASAALASHAAPPKIEHVLLISVDGLHSIDVSLYLKSHPHSTLANLAYHGIRYDNASVPSITDSFPGLAALVTGGSPVTTGFWYDVSYNRKLSPPAKTTPYGVVGGPTLCPSTTSTIVELDESLDADYTKLDGGGAINPDYLPRDPANGCAPVYPHSYLRVNTVFEVARQANLYTAWSDKHLAYEWVNGPSGTGVNDFWSPEINSIPVALPSVPGCSPLPDQANATSSNAWTDSVQNIRCYDALKVNAILNQIDGKTHDGSASAPVPAIFGFNFQAVSVGQKLKGNGYKNALAEPSAGLAAELDFVDASLQRILNELKAKNLYQSTAIILTAKHGQSPIDPTKKTKVPGSTPQDVIGGTYAFDISDDASLIWLQKPTDITQASYNLDAAGQAALGAQEVYYGRTLINRWDDPNVDERTPDIIVKVNTGVIFTGGSKLAEHGGLNDDDNRVALLISSGSIPLPIAIKGNVSTAQVAPSILWMLGLDPTKLQAVKAEGTQVLPFLP